MLISLFKNKWLLIFIGLIIFGTAGLARAQTSSGFEISGWVPYWRTEAGVASILPNLNLFNEVNPFIYTVRLDGTLNQASAITDQNWQNLKVKSKELGVKFIPTITWSNADKMHEIFSDPIKRQAHIQAITREIFANNFDGIDIDYEAKYAETRPYFSLFLKELYEAVGYNKWVMCTIESRTPLDSRYLKPEDIPADIEYANDFKEINKYCDRVRIMTYDQGRIDLKLNEAKGNPYAPAADKDWVEKAIRLAMADIDKDKLVIGVPTYGYEYDMFTALDGSGEIQYSQLWAFNLGYATDIASKLGLTVIRNNAGELMITFLASMSPEPSIPLPSATRVLSWSDAEAVKQKIELAKSLGVRGVAIFKIDGGQDPAIWNVLPSYANGNPKVALKPPVIAMSENPSGVPGGGTDIPGAGASSGDSLVMPTRDLEYGMRNEDVRTLQKYLNTKGFTVSGSGGGSLGNETTFFGPATRSALSRFQQEYKITPTAGYYGPRTRAVISSM